MSSVFGPIGIQAYALNRSATIFYAQGEHDKTIEESIINPLGVPGLFTVVGEDELLYEDTYMQDSYIRFDAVSLPTIYPKNLANKK